MAKVLCTNCHYQRDVNDRFIDRRLQCPRCGTAVLVVATAPQPQQTVPSHPPAGKHAKGATPRTRRLQPPPIAATVADESNGKGAALEFPMKNMAKMVVARWGVARKAASGLTRINAWLWMAGVVAGLLLLVATAILVGSAGTSPIAYRDKPSEHNNSPKMTSLGEESLKPTTLMTGRHQVYLDRIRSGMRAIVWRHVQRGSVSKANLRLSCGVWIGEGSLTGQLLNIDWVERSYVQLDLQSIDELIDQIRELDDVSFQSPSSDMGYREVVVNFGSLRFRKLPNQRIEVLIPLEDRDLWDQVDTDELMDFLQEARKKMVALDGRPTTIKWE